MRKSRFDWEAIRRDWELNQWTSRELAEKHGCSHTAINKRAENEGWVKNLAKQVANRTAEMLATDETLSQEDREKVEEAATKVVNVVRAHKAALRTQSDLVQRLTKLVADKLQRLESSTIVTIQTLDELAALTERLSRSLVRLMELERKTYGLDADTGDDKDGIDGIIDAARTNEDRVRRFRELFGRRAPGMAGERDS